MAITIGFLGCGYYLMYWMYWRRPACLDPKSCVRPRSRRTVKLALWTATALAAAATAFPYVAPALLGA